jgi:hypothetical protein
MDNNDQNFTILKELSDIHSTVSSTGTEVSNIKSDIAEIKKDIHEIQQGYVNRLEFTNGLNALRNEIPKEKIDKTATDLEKLKDIDIEDLKKTIWRWGAIAGVIVVILSYLLPRILDAVIK